MSTYSSDPSDPSDPVEPAGSDADILEQAGDAAGGAGIAFELPDDPEVPLADAWEGAIPVGDDDDERPHVG